MVKDPSNIEDAHFNNFIDIGIQAVRARLDVLTEIKNRQIDAVDNAARRITSDTGYRQCSEETVRIAQQQTRLNGAALDAIKILEGARK